MRHVLYITGTRADFGLMCRVLQKIHCSMELELSVLVTGMHLDERYGKTLREVEESGLPIRAVVPVDLGCGDGASMARSIGVELIGMVDAISSICPDIVMLLGDRGEMLAGAVAALHLNIPIVHIHGGERSGTVDEPIRHAISKLSHYHFTSTVEARERLIKMGECPDNIYVTGAPGLDGIRDDRRYSREELMSMYKLDSSRSVALVVFHPVVQDMEEAAFQSRVLLDALLDIQELQLVVLMPNSDAGNERIRESIYEKKDKVKSIVHFERPEFISWMAAADVMVGNSSSGIIEAATFGTPVVNVGDRQNGRERNSNVIDVKIDRREIREAVEEALRKGKTSSSNLYGDGNAGKRIVSLLSALPIGKELLKKSNAY